jgi:hypothetical protein
MGRRRFEDTRNAERRRIMSFNESTANRKSYLQVAWGVTKTLFLEKFSFGDEFFYAQPLQIDGSKSMFVRNPVFVYPVWSGIDSNLAAQVLDQFYDNSSLIPSCTIGARVTIGSETREIIECKFINVRVLEKFSKFMRRGQRNYSYYKLRYDDWTR